MPHYPKPWFRPERGSWYVQLEGKQIKLGPDRDEAFRKYHELMAKPPEAPKRLPADAVVQIIDAFLDWCQKHREGRTYEWYKERCDAFANFRTDAYAIQSLLVAELKPYHVQQWVDSKAGWSNGMKRGAIIAAQRAFNWAVKLGLLEKSPIEGIEKPAAGVRETVVTPELYKQIREHTKDQPFLDLVTLAWELGVRPQELLRLEARHVDRDKARWVFPVREAKGKKRMRIVHLTPAALAISLRLVLRYPMGKLLRNMDGVPWTRHAINCRFCRLQKKLGIKLCLYSFRHSFCHRALKNGVDPITLANLMGHVDTAMIARVYSNLAQDQKYLSDSMKRASA